MNRSKFFLIAAAMLATGLCSQSAVAVPVGGVLESEYSDVFDIAGGSGVVDSKVFSYGTGEYVYSYEIANSSDVGISFFSVAIAPGTDAYDPGFDSIAGTVDPAYWAPAGAPVQSVDGLFVDTIDNDGLPSAILWFKSSHSPTLGSAALFGTLSGVPYSTSADVLTPSVAPEPATVFLLGIGGALVTMTRRRRSF